MRGQHGERCGVQASTASISHCSSRLRSFKTCRNESISYLAYVFRPGVFVRLRVIRKQMRRRRGRDEPPPPEQSEVECSAELQQAGIHDVEWRSPVRSIRVVERENVA